MPKRSKNEFLEETKTIKFAEILVKNGFNQTAAYLAVNPESDKNEQTRHAARVQASRVVARDSTKKAIAEVMAEVGLNDEFVERIHKRNLKQGENIPASNTAIEMYHKLKGNLREGGENHLHLHAGKEVDEKIDAILAELHALKDQNTRNSGQ